MPVLSICAFLRMSPPRKKLTAINVLLPSHILLLVIYDPRMKSNDFIQLVTYQVQTFDYTERPITMNLLLLCLTVMQVNFILIYNEKISLRAIH